MIRIRRLKEELIMAAYKWDAGDYKKHSHSQQKWARELIAKLNCMGTEDLLDIGCGDGRVTAEIAGQVPDGSVVGIDNSESMIDLAKRYFPVPTHHNLHFMVMDAAKLSFEAEFDIVFSNAALHWVLDHQPVLAGIYRALRPGGKMLLQMGGKGNAERILSVLDVLREVSAWKKYFTGFGFPYAFFDTGEYIRLLTGSGFTANRVELIAKDMQHDGPEGLAGWLRTTWLPYTERIPEEKRERFIRDLVTAYLNEEPLDAAGKAHVAMMRLEVEARKT